MKCCHCKKREAEVGSYCRRCLDLETEGVSYEELEAAEQIISTWDLPKEQR